MIKNIVFDMGGVLRVFNRTFFVSQFDLNEDDKKTLLNEVFLSVEWSMMDRGTLSDLEAYEIIKNNLPDHLKQYAEPLVLHWEDFSYPIPGMAEVVRELKSNGYGIYLLSNASRRLYDYWPKLPGNECFDGMIVSCDYKLVKPQNEIYQLLNAKFNLNLDECVFIDDTTINVEGAMFNGMKGIVFHQDTEELRRKLHDLGVNISL